MTLWCFFYSVAYYHNETIKSRTIIYTKYMTRESGVLYVPRSDIFIPNICFLKMLLKLEDKHVG